MDKAQLIARKAELETLISQYDAKQNALKILANSLYGALGSSYFRLYDTDAATAITISGQTGIKMVQRYVGRLLDEKTGIVKNRSVAGDTDSTYFDLSDVAALSPETDKSKLVDFIDNFCSEVIEPEIEKTFDRVGAMFSSYTPKLSMKREAIAQAVIVAKKRYVFYVYDNEGVRYAKPKLKVTGLETARSSTPLIAKAAMLDLYHMMFNNTEQDVHAYIKDFQKEWRKLPADDMAKVMSVNGIEKMNTQQSKAASFFNREIDKRKLMGVYPKITNGQKIKLVSLVLPNPVRQPIMAYLDKLPEEFGLDKYINRDEIYDKVFLSAIGRVLGARGWTTRKINKVDNWMV